MPGFSKTFLLLYCFVSFPVLAQEFSSTGPWFTSESKNFRYHYLAENEHIVKRLYYRAESIHEHLSKYFNWQPQDKTDVIISDKTDFTNANARVIPANRIVLFLAPPNNVNGLEDFDLWLELIFLHEYVHILHLDRAEGFPLHLRKALGRHYLLFPNLYQPRWIIEGLATHLETDLKAKVGRGQSNYFKGLMRTEVASGIKSLGQVTQPVESWPQGTVAYLYGAYFFQFVEAHYGSEKLHEYLQHQSDFPIPYLIDIPFYQTFGKTTYFVWQEFEYYLINKFASEIERLKQQGLIAGKKITVSGLNSGFAQALDNEQLLMIQNDGFTPKAIWSLNIATQKKSHIADVYGDTFDYHPQQGILIPQSDTTENIKSYFDLYIISAKTGKQQRLTHNARYGKATWSTDGTAIAAVKTKHAKHQLDLLSNTGKFIETLWQTDEEVYLGDIDWSPTEQKIAATVWRKPQGWNIEIFDLQSKHWTAITNTSDIEGQARFTTDGKHIIYSADYSGIYNIYTQNLSTGSILQHTNVLGVARYPSTKPDNSILYAGLTGTGFDVFQLSPDSATHAVTTAQPMTENPGREIYALNKQVTKLDKKNYSLLQNFIPKWWQPIIAANGKQLGIFTSIRDPLAWNYISLSATYNTENELPDVDVLYIFQRYRFNLSLGYTRDYFYNLAFNNLIFDFNHRDSLSSTFSTSVVKNNYRLFFATGVDYQQWKRNSNYAKSTLSEDNGSYTLTGIAASFSNFRSSSRSVYIQNGFNISANFERTYRSSSNRDGNTFTSNLLWASPSINKTIFRVNAINALTNKENLQFALFGKTQYRLANANTLFGGSRSYKLRGYSNSALGLLNGRYGNILQFASIEWRFPIALLETGFILPPIGFNKLKASLFAEAGRAWFRGEQSAPGMSKSVGAELSLETTVLFRTRTEYRAGIAKGLDEYGEVQPYIVIGIQFF